jgi:trk system potassium uptake protein
MRVAIAGAGAVGRSIARELLEKNHEVLLIDKEPRKVLPDRIKGATWLLGDACEVANLEKARLEECDVVVGATGDDKVNLVVSLLAKTEFAVKRVVARINHPNNEWLFTDAWGVDVAVSTPRLMTALVEEAVSVGDLVRIFEFQQGKAMMVEMTLPVGSPFAGSRVGDVPFPGNTVLTGIIREGHPIAPSRDDALEPLDELLFITTPDVEAELESLLSPGQRHKRDTDNADDDDDA